MDPLAEKDVLIFVSPEGNDSNPATKTKPILSFDEAIRRLRPLWLKKQRIILAPGYYSMGKTNDADEKILQIHLGHQVGFEGEPLVFQGAFEADAVGQRQLTSSSATSVTDSTLKLEANQFAGARLRCASGALQGQAYLITGNTSDTISVIGEFAQGLKHGDMFVFERPAVTIEYEQVLGFEGSGATQLFMTGIKWVPRDPAMGARNAFVFDGGIKVFAEACEWDMRGGLFQASQSAQITLDGGLQQLVGSKLTAAGADGCYVHDGYSEFGIRATEAAAIFGKLLAQDIGISAQGGTIAVEMTSRHCKIISDGFQGNSFVMLGPANIIDAPTNAVTAEKNARLMMFQTSINGAKGHGVVVEERSYASLSNVTGSGNSGHGVSIAHGARVQADAASTVSGNAGDILSGGRTHSWSDVDAGISDPVTFARMDRGQ